ncbi:tetratricopeptide repeat protein [Echinicola rosea]|uniref:Tetratricopeptide repeat protein n=1 Tax=Echinicola rosea TaxID=1807691 RepID=A0ABQ1UHU0_9BACT|nr:tetratricopeptide repeat protein [Echinicola rosea]GGF18493.1 hypothetical protein GCM10011339_03010 [Echinicola rosea]
MNYLLNLVLAVLVMINVALAQDNPELQKMADADQQARFTPNIDWNELNRQDSIRMKRVMALMDQGKIKTAKDHYNAGIIFQHGHDTVASNLAVKCFGKAILMDSTLNKWWYAAAVDRDLMRKDKPQVYGTQYIQEPSTGKFKRYKIDTVKVSDEERQYYGVETLAQQQEKERLMNLKSVGDFYAKTNSIKKTMALIRDQFKKGKSADYDVSENKLINVGFRLTKASKNQEAMAFFQIITQLYPDSYNGYALYAGTLKKSGKMDEAITVLQLGQSLNPSNESLKNLLDEYVKTTENHE